MNTAKLRSKRVVVTTLAAVAAIGVGGVVDVALDKNLNVVTQSADTGTDADDRVLTDAERASAEKAALTAVTGGTILQVEAGDDGAAYEVEVRGADNAEWDVELDTAFKVLNKTADN